MYGSCFMLSVKTQTKSEQLDTRGGVETLPALFFIYFRLCFCLGQGLTERQHAVVFCPFRCSHVAEDSDLLRTVCTVFSGTACTHQPPGAVPWQERLVRSQEHHTDSRAHGMSASLYSKQVRMKALSVPLSLSLCLCAISQYSWKKKGRIMQTCQ